MTSAENHTGEGFADAWWCRRCNFGPLHDDDDYCPECGTHWGSDSPPADHWPGQRVRVRADSPSSVAGEKGIVLKVSPGNPDDLCIRVLLDDVALRGPLGEWAMRPCELEAVE